MLFAERAFPDLNRPAVERFGVGIAADGLMDQAKTGQRVSEVGMVGAERLFNDRQRTIEQWFGLRMPRAPGI